MKKLLLFICITLLCIGCSRTKATQDTETELAVTQEVIVGVQELDPIIDEALKEKRRQFNNMTIQDIVNLYVENRYMVEVVTDGNYYRGNFWFGEPMEWAHQHHGGVYYPYMHIIDDDHLQVDVFVYGIGSGEFPNPDENCRAGKFFVDITKDQLVDYWLGIKRSIDNFTVKEFFEVTEKRGERRSDVKNLYRVLSNAPVYDNSARQDASIGTISVGKMVKVINMDYKDLQDLYPVVIQIQDGDIDGWVDVNSVDFISTSKDTITRLAVGSYTYDSHTIIVQEDIPIDIELLKKVFLNVYYDWEKKCLTFSSGEFYNLGRLRFDIPETAEGEPFYHESVGYTDSKLFFQNGGITFVYEQLRIYPIEKRIKFMVFFKKVD